MESLEDQKLRLVYSVIYSEKFVLKGKREHEVYISIVVILCRWTSIPNLFVVSIVVSEAKFCSLELTCIGFKRKGISQLIEWMFWQRCRIVPNCSFTNFYHYISLPSALDESHISGQTFQQVLPQLHFVTVRREKVGLDIYFKTAFRRKNRLPHPINWCSRCRFLQVGRTSWLVYELEGTLWLVYLAGRILLLPECFVIYRQVFITSFTKETFFYFWNCALKPANDLRVTQQRFQIDLCFRRASEIWSCSAWIEIVPNPSDTQ